MSSVLDVLDIIDVIKNEAVYTQRLEALKKEQDKLKDYQFIAKTVDQAKRYLEEAKEAKEDAEDFMKQLEEDHETLKNKLEMEHKVRMGEVKKLEIAASEAMDRVKAASNRVDETTRFQDQRAKQLQEWDEQLKLKEKGVREMEVQYTSKFRAIVDIINGG